ncbi:probable disease resistance protein At4g27220 isoform X2 [Papaver somniferum]|uniref:probable disease resistance protein At4g27220 isoform X2 n=1 Tax=Papaver somniferum TaxID=3469 RepID=UPI000E6FBDD1|nr:probable disease resistance protein At4g27220 isoform X2 [Papaver somniferum]
MAETVATTVVGMAAEKGIQAIVHQIGYCIHYKRNVKSLDEKVKALQDMRKKIDQRVIEDKKNLYSIKNDVEIWLEKVKKEVEVDEIKEGLLNFTNGEEARMFNHDQCCKGWCCLLSRHKIGRKAQKKIAVIEVLFNEGKSFDGVVSYSCGNRVNAIINNFVSIDGYIDFESRKSIMKEIMSALKDKEIYSVGIYGMGGVGKTMLKNRVHKQVVQENLFNIVATTTVSQNLSVKKIQDDIAQILEFKKLNEFDDTTIRAALLLERLKQEQNILVILDDLWEEDLNLITHVGIPCRSKGCKVLITTRNLEVCNSLMIQKHVKLERLSEEESWNLFKQNVGDAVDSSALRKLARKVVKECGNLPLALVTVGSALKKKRDTSDWNFTVKQLKRSDYKDITRMTSKVYTPIKLSYDFLKSDYIHKRCFLLCCLFPEDYNINVVDLLIYAIGDEVIRSGLELLGEVRVRLQNAFTRLAALGLLIGDKEFTDKPFSTKMHDIVRHVAISIASKDDERFYVKVGLDFQKWPEELSSISNISRLSLIDNNITVLPEQPELPHLLSLSLRNNRSLEKIPEKFFTNMKALQSLDISRTCISAFPSSIISLVNLRALDMCFCRFCGQLDILGELKKLEILNLRGLAFYIGPLPREIGGLSRLKWLDLSSNSGLTVPPGIISRLTCLEYLNMKDSFQRWEVGESRGKSCRFANLDEIASLPCLNHLELEAVWDDGSLNMSNRGTHMWSDSLRCSLRGTFPFCNWIHEIVAKAEVVTLVGCSNLKYLRSPVTSSRDSGFNNIKRLEVSDCPEMVCVLNSSTLVNEEIPDALFTALEVLSLRSLGNLKEIFHGPMPAGLLSLENLKLVALSNCPNLVCLFSLKVMVKLKNMETLDVKDCEGLKKVFDGPMPAEFSLENLKRVQISNCPNLVCVSSLEVLVKLKNLEILQVSDCLRLKEIFSLEDRIRVVVGSNDGVTCLLPQLRELLLKNLPMITRIWSQEIFSLGNLKSVKVIDCHKLKYLFTPDFPPEEKDYADCDEKRVLVLRGVLFMEEIWGGFIPVKIFLVNITDARIDDCGWLKHLIPAQVLLSGCLSQLRKLQVSNCERLEAIIYTDDDIVVAVPQYKFILENLEMLTIWRCESLKQVLPLKLLVQGGIPKLEMIEVADCAEIKMICYQDPSSDDDDHDDDDDEIEETVEVFPKLSYLALYHLPKLTSLHQQRNTLINFGSLVSLHISQCKNLKRLPLSRTNVPPKLKVIWVDGEQVFEKWLESEDEIMKSSPRRLLFTDPFPNFWDMSSI